MDECAGDVVERIACNPGCPLNLRQALCPTSSSLSLTLELTPPFANDKLKFVEHWALFKKTSNKLQDGFAPILVLSTPLRWLKRVLGLPSDADSKTGSRVEQSETSRTTVRSVEITVETDEMIHLEKVTRTSSATALAEPVEANLGAESSREDGTRELAHGLPMD